MPNSLPSLELEGIIQERDVVGRVDLDRSGHSCPIHLFSGLTERKKERKKRGLAAELVAELGKLGKLGERRERKRKSINSSRERKRN